MVERIRDLKSNDYDIPIYLAGPMEHCTPSEINGWRKKMQGEYPFVSWLIPNSCVEDGRNNYTIFRDDIQMVASSKIIFAYMWKPSIGTSMEIYAAYMMGIPIICAVDDQVSSNHPFLTQTCTWVVEGLDNGIKKLGDMEMVDLFP